MSMTYRCTYDCPIHKSCFICKVNRPVPDDTVFFVKCICKKIDLAISAKDAKKTK